MPGEKVKDQQIQAWQEWENRFFDAEEAMVVRQEHAVAKAKAKAKAMPKPKIARKAKVPVTVKAVRQGGYHHIAALDKILYQTLGYGLDQFQRDDSDDWRGLVTDVIRLPKTLVLHLDEEGPAYSMCWYLLYKEKLRFMMMRDIYHREWNDIRLALG